MIWRPFQLLSIALWQDCPISVFRTYYMYFVCIIFWFPIDLAKQLPGSIANLTSSSLTAGSPSGQQAATSSFSTHHLKKLPVSCLILFSLICFISDCSVSCSWKESLSYTVTGKGQERRDGFITECLPLGHILMSSLFNVQVPAHYCVKAGGQSADPLTHPGLL